jgi:hypothetical protein
VGNEKLPLHSLNIRWWRKQMLGDEKSEDFSIKTTEFETILPSGKRLHNYGNSPFITAKSSITGPFSIATVKNYRRLPEGK